LPTNDHISSNWTSRVRGGKSHELVMSVAGVFAGQLGQAGDGVAMDVEEASGLPDAAALGEVVEDGAGLLLGQVGVEQGRPLALGEAVLAGVAVEQPDVVLLAVASADREISGVAPSVGGAVGILAAEASEVIHTGSMPKSGGSDAITGSEPVAAPILLLQR
jgi:hypothetical protein